MELVENLEGFAEGDVVDGRVQVEVEVLRRLRLP